jgi:hypothetical protein
VPPHVEAVVEVNKSQRKEEIFMPEGDDALVKATAEANSIFAKMRASVEEAVKGGATQLDVAEIARKSGLKLEERTLEELKVDRIIYCYPWLPWYSWWPWRPLWCWWWHRYYPWYRCCPWWWYRCHWYPW